MAESSQIEQRVDALKVLSDEGRLSPVTKEEPDIFHQQLQVCSVQSGLPRYAAFWVVLVFAALFSFLAVLCFADSSASFAVRAFCIGMAFFLFFLAWITRKAQKKLLSNPVCLRIYKHGIWLNRNKVFIPYERLLKLETESSSLKGMEFRYSYFSTLSGDGRVKRFGIDNSGLDVSYGEILDKVYALAADFNKKNNLLPPLLIVDSAELTEDEFKELQENKF